eukprot:705374-Amorphochlora_amoeboformis.AAC.1
MGFAGSRGRISTCWWPMREMAGEYTVFGMVKAGPRLVEFRENEREPGSELDGYGSELDGY